MKRKQYLPVSFAAGLLTAATVTTFALGGCGTQSQSGSWTDLEGTPISEAADVKETVSETGENQKTARTAAMEAYRKLLEESPAIEGEHDELYDLTFGYDDSMAKFGKHYDYYAVLDVNKDDVPELIVQTVVNQKWTPVSVFTYNEKTGEVLMLKDPQDLEAQVTFGQMSTAGGAYSLFICRDNHIHNMWGGDTPVGYQTENYAYVMKGSELEAAECNVTDGESASDDILFDFSEKSVKNTEENRKTLTD